MAILGVVLVTDKNLKEGTTSLTNRVEIEVFIKGAPPQQSSIDALRAKIAGMPQVKSFTLRLAGPGAARPQEDARLRRLSIVRTCLINPLPASYKIFVKNPNEVDKVAQRSSSTTPTSTTTPAPPTA
jgi:cell division protein FtsX